MNKPMPTQEIIVERARYRTRSTLNIQVSSDRAVEWIRKEAGSFGRLFGIFENTWELEINGCYDADDVTEYLMSLGE